MIDRYLNHEMEVKDGILTIRIVIDETKVDVQPSASGKTLVIATSGGGIKVPHTPLRLGFNLYRKP